MFFSCKTMLLLFQNCSRHVIKHNIIWKNKIKFNITLPNINHRYGSSFPLLENFPKIELFFYRTHNFSFLKMFLLGGFDKKKCYNYLGMIQLGKLVSI
jgi:hypothetical protein